ncbi:MAG TPA: hypothetical protein VM142_10645 [Acidimicrobiales bacterium]|nr:hypothetical protein [Acidimicrobiales bacterium]
MRSNTRSYIAAIVAAAGALGVGSVAWACTSQEGTTVTLPATGSAGAATNIAATAAGVVSGNAGDRWNLRYTTVAAFVASGHSMPCHGNFDASSSIGSGTQTSLSTVSGTGTVPAQPAGTAGLVCFWSSANNAVTNPALFTVL